MKQLLKSVFVFSCFLLLSVYSNNLFSQVPDGGITDPDAPIDGGLGILVAAGVGYGIKKARDKKKKKKNLLQ